MQNNFEFMNRSYLASVLLAYEELTSAPPAEISIDDMVYHIRRKNGKPVTYKHCIKKIKSHFSDMLLLLVSTQYIARVETEKHTRAYFFGTESDRDTFIENFHIPNDKDTTIEVIEPDELIDYASPYIADPENYYVNGSGIPVFMCNSLQAD